MFWIKRLNKGAFRMAALSAKLSFKKASPNVSFGSDSDSLSMRPIGPLSAAKLT